MSSLIIILITFIAFFWGYRVYARRFEALCEVDPKRPTPAITKHDGVDYVPAHHWLVLFGHHFSSIAGAGPIIGPVIACIVWGWLPALLWIIFGTIFIGGIHDFGTLFASLRAGGTSIADIAQNAISRKAKIIFSVFVWLALILVNAVFAYLCADTFVKEPKIVLPSLGLIPIALFVGYLLYKIKFNHFLSAVIGVLLLTGLIFLGNELPIGGAFTMWIVILFVYAFVASVLPVNVLLQPRDYISSFLLFAGVGIGYLGLILSHPKLTQPAYTGWQFSQGGIWPMMCVTIACGAISGFHSLISSGTTSKQLANEKHARRIGYGAMVAEGFVAVMAVLVVCAGLKGNNLMSLLKEAGPVNSFSQGYGAVTKTILGGYGAFIAVTILNAFILTTLDTATRISRYLTEELFGVKNRYFATALVIVVSAALALSGAWQKIWPIFGASNQLVAALALLVLSCWLLGSKKTLKFTIAPAIFMFATTVAALILQIKKYFFTKDYILLSISAILLLLAIYLLWESARVLLRRNTMFTKRGSA